MMIDNSCGGDPGNGGSNCDPNDPTCGNPQPPDQQGCDWNADPTCGGRVGMDPCLNPFAASCGNPWEAQGLPFLSPGLNMSSGDDPLTDPCVTTSQNKAGNWQPHEWPGGISPGDCKNVLHGTWVAPGWGYTVNPDGSLNLFQQQSSGWCSALEFGGVATTTFASGVFLWGFAADATGVGAPVGLFSQASAGVGMAVGSLVGGVGVMGQKLGLCH